MAKNGIGRSIGRRLAVCGVMVFALACTSSDGRERETEPASAAAASEAEEQTPELITILHLAPARDSIGELPAKFEWTPVKGADFYEIGLWNDVDRLLWQQGALHDASIPRPKELDLDAGTYFWRVTAVQGERKIGDSGWAAFVVRR